ncbi:MAG: RecB family exonuclease, partial [Nocardioidaceae bacterium]
MTHDLDEAIPAGAPSAGATSADPVASEPEGEDPFAGLTRTNSLSPSRASDFMSCPLLYRFRVIDRLPEKPSIDAVRGSVVHKVLEDLFDLPAFERTRERANLLLEPIWESLLAEEPELAEMFAPGPSAAPGSSAAPGPSAV